MPKPFSESNLVRAPLLDIQAGLFADVHPMAIPLGGASVIRNLVYVDGYVKPRAGLGAVYSAPDSNRVVHINRYVPLSGTVELFRVSRDSSGNMHVWTNRPSTGWVQLTVAGGIAGVLTPNGQTEYQPMSANFNGSIYLVPGNGNIYRYNGTTFVDLNTLITDDLRKPFAKPRFIMSSDSRLFIADFIDNFDASAVGATRFPFGVAWCDSSDPLKWSTGSSVGSGTATFQYIPQGSEPITAIYPASNQKLLIFKAREIYLGSFVGSPKVFKFELLVRGPGCISQATIKEWRNNTILWLGDDNVYLGLPGETPQPVGDRIRPILYAAGATFALSKSRAVLDRDNDLYHLIIPEASGTYAGQTLHIFTLNLRNNSWWEGAYNLGSGVSVEDALEYRVGPWQSRQLLALSNGAILDQSFGYASDNGNAYTTRWESGVVAYRALSNNKSEQGCAQMLRALARSGSVRFDLIWGDGMDRFTTTPFTPNTQTFDGSSALYVSGRATSEHFKVAFYHDTVASAAPLMGLIFGYTPQGDTR